MSTDNDCRSTVLERTRQRLLLVGVVLGALLLACGGVLLLMVHGERPVDFSAFHGEPAGLRSLGKILLGAAHLEPHAVVEAGLLLLIGVQFAQVSVALIGFARAHDMRYVGISALLLALLVTGFVLGG